MRDTRTRPAVIAAILLLLPAACSAPKGIYHKVQPGQTLYSISRAYNVNENYLARLNGIENPGVLRTGQQVFIPGAAHLIDVPIPRPAKDRGDQASAASKGTKTAAAPATPPKSQPSHLLKRSFVWPLRGALLRNFGLSGNRNCNGIEIAAPEATPIAAAAAGQVTYSGDGIRGYGNLIIIRHEDSVYTVYGYNSKNLVVAGDVVKQGEKIALSGVAPTGGEPCLHFEIRQGKAAVNPIFYLP